MSRRFRPVEAKKKGRSKAFLPLVGIVLAVALGVVAYFVAPILIEFAEDQSADIARQFARFRVDYGENAPDYVAACLLWMVMLAVTVFIVAAAIGEDPEKEVFRYMGPSPADRDKHIKQLRRELKEAKRRAKQ